MYLTKNKVGKPNSEIEPYLYFCDEKFNSYGYYDINYVTWWTLKYNGIPINSPNVSSLNINVQWNNIVETMNYNLNSYWKKKLCEKNIFLSDEWIEFAVLTLCRILYTLDNKSIATKIESAKYTIMSIPDDQRSKHRLPIESLNKTYIIPEFFKIKVLGSIVGIEHIVTKE
ncbi:MULTISPECIES: aminoglycoside adenylyltransferase domain-containing protein [Clostridium]|nr:MULTISPECIES: aminoglycoside adenylyltransferase domain-containing protein [Clostridium]ADK15516.1 hypothetical protein CLJU_c24580 [Clostridium ljungdahlii DSM 13528]